MQRPNYDMTQMDSKAILEAQITENKEFLEEAYEGSERQKADLKAKGDGSLFYPERHKA